VAAVKEDASSDSPKVAGKPLLRPPWKTLRLRDLKQIVSQDVIIYLEVPMQIFDRERRPTALSKPTITQLTGPSSLNGAKSFSRR
jgi:hypothetical protein